MIHGNHKIRGKVKKKRANIIAYHFKKHQKKRLVRRAESENIVPNDQKVVGKIFIIRTNKTSEEEKGAHKSVGMSTVGRGGEGSSKGVVIAPFKFIYILHKVERSNRRRAKTNGRK